MEGSLSKWTNVMKGWQYRWFVLDSEAGVLSYYTSKEKMKKKVRRGSLRLRGAVLGIEDDDSTTFTITVDSKTFHLQARDAQERELWVAKLEEAVIRHDGRLRPASSRSLVEPPAPGQQADLLNRLSEADKLLRLLSEQTIVLQQKTQSMGECQEKSKCEAIQKQASEMLEHVKQTIVLLRNAKNSVYPTMDDSQSEATTSTASPSNPPESSSSTSEEEDNFYDAPEELVTLDVSKIGNNSTLSTSESNKSLPICIKHLKTPPNPLFLNENGEINYDAIYEDNLEGDLSLDANCSIISHLISQVRVGMDLTKVALPTFILEKRSLLEMYADFFAHPDMFVKIAELGSEEERMVQVVRWYLCSYHAGRKSKVPKKPYNPILGEIFQCYWNTSGKEGNNCLVADGPVPWCRANQLSFVAEQVSHHPPISAFYAEHYNNRISFNGYVWTKSKFLGLSIGVHNIGSGTLHLTDHDEVYVMTFPNGYGRSILTVPWVELGGSVELRCEKTGYYASVEFITKPFYGGKKHRVLGEVFAPNSKKPFMTITGEWNGRMFAKRADGAPEVFADIGELSVVKKMVRPVAEQQENESRRVWKEVTAGLSLNDVAYATKAKTEIEVRQRGEATRRKKEGIPWQTKLFSPVGDRWQYNTPLNERLNFRKSLTL